MRTKREDELVEKGRVESFSKKRDPFWGWSCNSRKLSGDDITLFLRLLWFYNSEKLEDVILKEIVRAILIFGTFAKNLKV